MRRPIQPTDRPLEPTPTSSLLSCTPSTSRSVRSLQTEAFAGTRVGSTSARRWATSSSGSNPSVWLCGKSTSDPLPSRGLTKNSSSFATPTVTQDVTQSVNHQLAPLCQPSGALFSHGEYPLRNGGSLGGSEARAQEEQTEAQHPGAGKQAQGFWRCDVPFVPALGRIARDLRP